MAIPGSGSRAMMAGAGQINFNIVIKYCIKYILYNSESPTFKSDPTKPFDMVVDLFGTVKGYTASDDMNLIGVGLFH